MSALPKLSIESDSHDILLTVRTDTWNFLEEEHWGKDNSVITKSLFWRIQPNAHAGQSIVQDGEIGGLLLFWYYMDLVTYIANPCLLTEMLSENEKAKLTNRLRRISGQVTAIQRMIDEDEYCIDILMQIAAANGALGKVGQLILESHVHSCVTDAMQDGSSSQDREEKLEELIKVFRKYSRIAD